MNTNKNRMAMAVGLLLAALLAGCSQESSAGGYCLFRPGEKWLLTYAAEMTVTWKEEGDGDPRDSLGWVVELPLSVGRSWDSGQVEVTMTIQSLVEDGQSQPVGQEVPLDDGAPIELSATLDKNRRVVALNPQGETFAELKSDFEEYKKEAETSPEAAEMFATKQEARAYVQRQYDAAVRCRSMGAYGALEAVTPYLPTDDVAVGDTWPVHREKVYPQIYAFLIIPNGATCSFERATCVVKGIQETAQGRLATIEITGRRVPGPRGIPGAPEEDMEARVDFFKLTGELVFNLDMREIVSLRITTDPHAKDADNPWDVQFVDMVSLQLSD